MMRCSRLLGASLVVAAMACTSPGAYHVSVDLSGLGGSGVELEASLYDISGVIGDSWALIDNVALGSATDDFESGGLGAFDASLNPTSVVAVLGSLNGAGSYVMRIDEDPLFSPTITFRDYLSPSADLLTFEFDMTASDTAGFWGYDELVFSLLDPDTLDPLCYGLTGTGDFLAVDSGGLRYADTVTVTPTVIPAPGAFLLGIIGISGMGMCRRKGSD